MHVALLFPPATDPRSPHLAIPSLAAFLRGAGIRVSVHDLDLAGLLATIEPDRVVDAVDRCRRRHTREPDGALRDSLTMALAVADVVVDHIGSAPDVLRDHDAFCDPTRFHLARECINTALTLVSLAHGGVDYNTGPIRYDVAGCHAGRLADLERVTADPGTNLFDDLYRFRLLPDLEADRPDVVGISLLNAQQIVPGLHLARLLKSRGHLVVLGGTVYAKFEAELARRPRFLELFCDAVCVREGETALLEVCERVAVGRSLAGTPNLVALDPSGRAVAGPVHIEDVKALPTPDFAGLPLDDYLAPTPVLPILTGKGCYFNRCKFCDIPSINSASRRAYRLRPPEQVADDVVELHRRHGARFFEITDEALAPNLLLRIGDALERNGGRQAVAPRFVGYARLEPAFTAEACARIHDMGMRKLFFGLESGSQAVLDHMDKGITLDNATRVLRHCTDAGIAFHLFSIVGFPEETEAQARETLRFFLDNAELIDRPEVSFDIHPFTLDLRTEYFDRADDFGVRLDVGALRRIDFPLSADRWSNRRGLDEAQVERLLEEFQAALRARFPTWRRFPAQVWPGFEEYSIIYAERYEGRPFPYRRVLPPPGEPTPIRLSWVPGTFLQAADGDALAWSLLGSATVPGPLLALLGTDPVRPALPVDELLDALAAEAVTRSGQPSSPTARARAAARLRSLLDPLVNAGVLLVEPDSSPPVASLGAHAPGQRAGDAADGEASP
ncbi:MAG: B12-binding domain-containing radical SAM protein [Acidimicrobiales bacterium]|nr:B12-binding domain-containing radical SAM protein [Acidimicrobiales bacterium]